MFNKKADGGLTVIVIIVIIVVFLGWLINLGGWECNSNSDCKSESYCGVDHTCHKIPVIERTTTPVVVNRDYTKPSWIIGGAIVLASLFYNFDKIKPKRRNNNNDQWGQIYY